MKGKISVDGVTKCFGALKALDKVSFSTSSGINVILGPNGAGKSTLLRCIDGLYKLDLGSISVLDKDPYADYAIKSRMSLLSDAYGLYDFLSVYDNMRFFGRLQSLSPRETEKRYMRILKELDAAKYLHAKVSTLSRGTKQKVAFCRAILNDPEILLLDEPTAFLDVKASGYIREFMLDYARAGRTVLFVTQKIDEVTRFNSRILVIRSGRIVRDIDSEGLYGSILRNSYVNIRLAKPISWKIAASLPGYRGGNAADPTMLKIRINGYKDISKAVKKLLDNGAYVVGIDFIEPAIEKLSFGD
jgi:ABC-2 type transport system ATP-binding protein